ncbi:MAG: hypothetical protein HZA48_07095 [Planctomycetes bacterium]|nr:hypothetical protein [Planctomycetota bacterium]
MEECEKCLKCGGSIKQGDMFCSACGSEVTSAKSEKAPAVENLHELELAKKYSKAINNGRQAILVIIILYAICVVLAIILLKIAAQQNQKIESFGIFILIFIAVLFMAIYIALWAWAKTKPFPAILTALCIYSVLITINLVATMVYTPNMAFAVMIWILISIKIISVLSKGITAAYRYEKLIDAGKGASNE